jgi:3-oxoacyl-[acyl-carrier-protein] synthase II
VRYPKGKDVFTQDEAGRMSVMAGTLLAGALVSRQFRRGPAGGDRTVLETIATRDGSEILANEILPGALKPTLFLAQLANLLAGNISIIHNGTGASRTFMGEEMAGIAAIEMAVISLRDRSVAGIN